MARNRQALALALRSLGAVKHSALAPVHLASESVRGLLLLPRISIENLLPPPSTGSSSVQEASSSDQDSCFYGESRDACRTGAASLQQGSLNGTFALDGVPAHRGRVSCKVQRNSIHEEVLGAVRSSFGCRCIHASRTAAAEKSSRSGGGEAGPIEEGGQISGVPGKEGEGQPGQEAEPTVAKVDPQGFNRDSSSRFQAADARSASGPGLRQQGDESWQGSPADGAALSNLTILEQMLRELEGTKRGHGVGAAEDDQFLASLRLRLAQEYAAHNIKTQEAEGLAIKAWQVRLPAAGHHCTSSLFLVTWEDQFPSISPYSAPDRQWAWWDATYCSTPALVQTRLAVLPGKRIQGRHRWSNCAARSWYLPSKVRDN